MNHQNLVQLVGWATSDPQGPMIVHEYPAGQSIAHQLHQLKWKPTELDVLKVARDVAKGLEYLHSHHRQPITSTSPVTHRYLNLNSSNIFLCHPPPYFGGMARPREICVKILARGTQLDDQLDGD